MRPTIRIHDTASDKVIDREMTDAEFAQYEIDQATLAELLTTRKQVETDKAAAEAKLAALGLTTNDLKALGL